LLVSRALWELGAFIYKAKVLFFFSPTPYPLPA
jgi:hypothetical protein